MSSPSCSYLQWPLSNYFLLARRIKTIWFWIEKFQLPFSRLKNCCDIPSASPGLLLFLACRISHLFSDSAGGRQSTSVSANQLTPWSFVKTTSSLSLFILFGLWRLKRRPFVCCAGETIETGKVRQNFLVIPRHFEATFTACIDIVKGKAFTNILSIFDKAFSAESSEQKAAVDVVLAVSRLD